MMLPGVDAPPFALEPYKPTDKFVIGHFGSLSETRNLAGTIAALDLLIDQRPELDGKVELHVYGGPLDPISAAAVTKAKHSTLRHFGRIEADPVTGKSGREQILQRMRGVDVLLLLHGVEPICAEYIPSKMYEYLWMQRPILALVCRNDQMESLLLYENHRVIQEDHADSTTEFATAQVLVALLALTQQWNHSGLPDLPSKNVYTTEASVCKLLSWTSVTLMSSGEK
jgi:hypothetical protein